MPGRRPKDVREPSGRGPGGARRECRRSAAEGLDYTFLAFGGRRRGQRKNNGNSARGCLTFSVKTVKLQLVFDNFADTRFSLTGAMVLHSFAKPPRLCTKCVFTAPVHKNERRSVENGSGTRVLTLKCVFSPRLCSKRQWTSSPPRIKTSVQRYLSIERCD